MAGVYYNFYSVYPVFVSLIPVILYKFNYNKFTQNTITVSDIIVCKKKL